MEIKNAYKKRFILISALMISVLLLFTGCGGKEEIPLTALKKSLKDKPSYSILLDDMKKEGTFFKTFFHKYLVVQPEDSQKTDWLQVPEKYYTANRDFLGMTLLTKKDGILDDLVAPPGYGFVGDSSYGRWREDKDGNSFWEFYGKYAFFSSLFGGWYHPIHRHDYRTYRSNKSHGRPFFGSKKQYGSSGALVKKKKPGFFQARTSVAKASKQTFKNRVKKRIGRTKTVSIRGRAGGVGK